MVPGWIHPQLQSSNPSYIARQHWQGPPATVLSASCGVQVGAQSATPFKGCVTAFVYHMQRF